MARPRSADPEGHVTSSLTKQKGTTRRPDKKPALEEPGRELSGAAAANGAASTIQRPSQSTQSNPTLRGNIRRLPALTSRCNGRRQEAGLWMHGDPTKSTTSPIPATHTATNGPASTTSLTRSDCSREDILRAAYFHGERRVTRPGQHKPAISRTVSYSLRAGRQSRGVRMPGRAADLAPEGKTIHLERASASKARLGLDRPSIVLPHPRHPPRRYGHQPDLQMDADV